MAYIYVPHTFNVSEIQILNVPVLMNRAKDNKLTITAMINMERYNRRLTGRNSQGLLRN